MTSALGLPRSGYRSRSFRANQRIAVSGSGGLPTSTTSGITCASDQVALVDRIVFTGLSRDAAENETITLEVNGTELPFHFPGIINRRRSFRQKFNLNGNLVVQPGQTLEVKAANATNASIEVHYRLMQQSQAWKDGYFTGGTMPTCASTNTVAGSGLSAGTAKNIVPGVAGKHIQVLGFAYTGHNFNAAEDSARIGFWDGSTGTFDANANRFMKVYRMGADPDYADPVLIGDTHGCIQGGAGLGLYVDATTNLAGATPTGDFVVFYRYIDSTDVLNTTGAVGGATSGKRFWLYTETAPTQTTGASISWFGAGMPDVDLHVLGQAGSFTCVNEAAVSSTAALGLGTDSTLPLTALHVMNSDGDGTPAEISSAFCDDDLGLLVNSGFNPCFTGTMLTASGVNRSHLIYGTIGGSNLNTEAAGATLITRTVFA